MAETDEDEEHNSSEKNDDTSNNEENTYLEQIYKISRWNPIFCINKRNETTEPDLKKGNDASDNNNNNNKTQWSIKDEVTNPVKEDSCQPGTLVKNGNHNNFSLSENKKSRRQEESSKKIFRSNQGLLTKMMILTLAVVRCTSAKSIDGLIQKN